MMQCFDGITQFCSHEPLRGIKVRVLNVGGDSGTPIDVDLLCFLSPVVYHFLPCVKACVSRWESDSPWFALLTFVVLFGRLGMVAFHCAYQPECIQGLALLRLIAPMQERMRSRCVKSVTLVMIENFQITVAMLNVAVFHVDAFI